jgi:hypothetical protein
MARPLPYPAEQVRSVTLLADRGQLWLAVTAAVPVERHDLDPARIAGVDLGVIHPYSVVCEQAGLLVSGRAIRAENYLHLHDQRARQRQAEARHRRRVHQAHHEAANQVMGMPFGTELPSWSSETPRASPTATWAGSRTSAYGSGAGST